LAFVCDKNNEDPDLVSYIQNTICYWRKENVEEVAESSSWGDSSVYPYSKIANNGNGEADKMKDEIQVTLLSFSYNFTFLNLLI
jgi:hypothetical protein